MARLFIAIDLPEEHKALLRTVRDEKLQARWTPQAKYHLTLRFLGDVPEAQIPALQRRLAAVAFVSFSLAGQGLGVFPSYRRPRVLFAALNPAPALIQLQAAIENALLETGFDAEPKAYHPHVTLARLRRPDAKAVRTFCTTHRAFVLPPFAVRHFTLYESTLRPEGALHTPRCVLTASEPPSVTK